MPQTNNRGFTLLEVLIVIALLVIGTAIVIPSFREIGKRGQVKATTRQIKDEIALARSEAIRRNSPVVISFSDKKITVDGQDIPLEIESLTAQQKTGVDGDGNETYEAADPFQWNGRGYPSPVGKIDGIKKIRLTITGKEGSVFYLYISPSGGIDITQKD